MALYQVLHSSWHRVVKLERWHSCKFLRKFTWEIIVQSRTLSLWVELDDLNFFLRY